MVPLTARHTFTDLVSDRECTLVIDPDRVGVEHPGCQQLAGVSPELDAFYCTACQWNGRVSGAWVVDRRG